MGGGYKFDPEAAKQVEKGLKAATAELEETGYFSIQAQQGHGFQFMAMSGMEMGNGELADVFSQFCARWGIAVHGKMQDLNDIGLSAGLYHEQEQYVNDTLKEVVVTAGSYNPQQGLAEGDKAGEKSWGEVWGDVKPKMEVDYSQPDWGAMGDQWSQVGDDFGNSPWQDVAGPDRWDDSEWQWDGPPEQGGQEKSGGDGGS